MKLRCSPATDEFRRAVIAEYGRGKHGGVFKYMTLPTGMYGWVHERSGNLVQNPIILAALYKWGREAFPGYEEASRKRWQAELAELNRMMAAS